MHAPTAHILVSENDPNISDTPTRQARQPLRDYASLSLIGDRASGGGISLHVGPRTGPPPRQIEPGDAED